MFEQLVAVANGGAYDGDMRVLLTLLLGLYRPALYTLMQDGCTRRDRAAWAAVLGKLADTLTRSGHNSHLRDLDRDDDVCLANDR